MTIWDLKEGQTFKNGETCIKKIKFYINYNKDNIKGKLFYPDMKEIPRELAEQLNNYNNTTIEKFKTVEIDVNELKNGYQIEYDIYFTSVKNSAGISICNSVRKFILGWT